MGSLILLRHGMSAWNKANLFTGWVDVPLCQEGIVEAYKAGEQIKDFPIDVVFCSTLVRSIMTAMIALTNHSSGKVPVIQHEDGRMHAWGNIFSEKAKDATIPVYLSEALNERMYGALQGMNKQEMREKFGDEQVHVWRRSYHTQPPEGESLEDTCARAIPYFCSDILPRLQKGENVFVAAHGNSLRAIVKVIENISNEDISKFEIATGVPRMYEMKQGALHLV